MGWLDLLHLNTFTEFGTTGNYSVIAILHTFEFTVTHALGFSVIISHILVTDLSHFRCKFKSHIESSFHSLTPFLSLICDCQFRRVDSIPAHIPTGSSLWSLTLHFRLDHCFLLLLLLVCESKKVLGRSERHFIVGGGGRKRIVCEKIPQASPTPPSGKSKSEVFSALLYPLGTDHTKNVAFIITFTDPIPSNGCHSVACARFAGMCLPSRCVAMDIQVTLWFIYRHCH
jgi:hypothetical protein